MYGELVPILNKDLELILKWRNQQHIRDVMYNSDEIKWEEHLKWHSNMLGNQHKLSRIFMYKNNPLGILNINNINKISNRCEWGFYIGASNTPKGTGLSLGYTSLNYIFEQLGIRKVCAEVLDSNGVSKKFHEKLGFKQEGILRQHIYRNNQYEDIYVYSIFYDEWELNKKDIENELNILFVMR